MLNTGEAAPINAFLLALLRPCFPLVWTAALPAHQDFRKRVLSAVFAELRQSLVRSSFLARATGHLGLHSHKRVPVNNSGVIVAHKIFVLLSPIDHRPFADRVGYESLLIEEVSNLIDEVVLIDQGKVLLQESVEDLLAQGYSISGAAAEVDGYCAGRNVIGTEELGGLKIAYIMGEKMALPKESTLQISAMNLQKLFVKMTEKRGEENE